MQFNASSLVRLLDGLALGDGQAPLRVDGDESVAERLARWMRWTDAIALSGVLAGVQPAAGAAATTSATTSATTAATTSATTAAATARPAPAAALQARWRAARDDLQQVRAALVRLISLDEPLCSDRPLASLPLPGRRPPPAAPGPAQPAPAGGAAAPQPGTRAQPALDPAAYRQPLQALQRDIADRVDALRERLRTQLRQAAAEAHAPALQALAALDAALQPALAERELLLLGTLPGWLEKRLRRLQAEAPPAPAPGPDGQAPGLPWLAQWGLEARQLLLAELEHRLQPLHGLLQALADAQAAACRPDAALPSTEPAA